MNNFVLVVINKHPCQDGYILDYVVFIQGSWLDIRIVLQALLNHVLLI